MISQKVGIQNLTKIANQIGNLNEQLISDLETRFTNVDSKEFLIGLISGYIVSVELLQRIEPNSRTIDQLRAITVFLADKYLKMI